jgi:hypothetical protein
MIKFILNSLQIIFSGEFLFFVLWIFGQLVTKKGGGTNDKVII